MDLMPRVRPVRALLMLLLAAILPAGLHAGGGDPASLTMVPSETSLSVGDHLQVELHLDAGAQPAARVGVFVGFDHSRLRFDGGMTNTAVFNNSIFTGNPVSMEPGVVSFSAAATSALSGSGILVATLDFTVLASGETTLDYLTTPPRETSVAAANGDPLPSVVSGTTVSVDMLPVASLILAPPFQSATAGESYDFEVRLDTGGQQVRQVNLFVGFNADVLEFESAAINHETFDSLLITSAVDSATTGIVSFRAGSFLPVEGGNLLVATLRFRALMDGDSPIDFLGVSPRRTQVKDGSFANLLTTTRGSHVHVGSGVMARLSLAPETQIGPVGEAVQVAVMLDSLSAPAGVVIGYVDYDESRLEFQGGSINESVFDSTGTNQPPTTNGSRVTFTGFSGPGVMGSNFPVAFLEFRTTNPGIANMTFLTELGANSQVLTHDTFVPLPLVVDGGFARAELVGAAELRFDAAVGAVEPLGTYTVDVKLDANGEAVRRARVFMSYDPALLDFAGGTLNEADFADTMFNTQPGLAIEPGVITFGANALADVTGNDVTVATLSFTAKPMDGVASFEFLTRNSTETALQTASFSTIPTTVGSGAVFIREDNLSATQLARVDDSPTSEGLIRWSLAFNSQVAGVDLSDFALLTTPTLSGASLLAVEGSGADYMVTASTGQGEGAAQLFLVDDDTIIDGSFRLLGGPGAGNGDFAGDIYAVDTVAPNVMLATAEAIPTMATSVAVTASFTEPVSGFGLDDVQLTGGTAANLAGGPAIYTFDVEGLPEGLTEVFVGGSAAFDVAGNGSEPSSNTLNLISDQTAPTAVITRLGNSPTNASTVSYSVEFNESVGTSFTVDDVTTFGSLTAAVLEQVSGAGASYTVSLEIDDLEAEGTLGFSIGTDVFDVAGNMFAGAASELYEIDLMAPTAAFTRLDPALTSLGTVRYSVTFSEPVTGVAASSFMATSTGAVSGAGISGVTGAGADYVVSIDTGSGDGTVSVEAAAAHGITDLAGNGATFSTAEAYTVDKTPPMPTLATVLPFDTSATDVDLTVTFTEPVMGMNAAFIDLSSGTVSNLMGSGASYSFTAAGVDEGAFAASVLAGAASDAAGGSSTASNMVSLNIDRTAPTAVITRTGPLLTNSSSLEWTVSFSEGVGSTFTGDDVSTSGSLTGTVSVAGTDPEFTVTLELDGSELEGEVAILIGSAVTDAAGNAFAGAASAAYTVDQVVATVQATLLDPTLGNAASVRFALEFGEAISGLTAANLVLNAAGLTDASISSVVQEGDGTWTVTADTGTGDGTLSLSSAVALPVEDLAGNVFAPFTSAAYTIDRTRPTVESFDTADTNPTSADQVSYLLSFSEAVVGVDANDFNLTTSGLTGAGIASVSAVVRSDAWQVVVNTGSGNGALRLTLQPNGTILDLAGNELAGGGVDSPYYIVNKEGAGSSGYLTTQIVAFLLGENPFELEPAEFDANGDGIVDGADAAANELP